MTPRERILTALDHETPDHTPTDGWFHPEIMGRLQAHFGTDSEEAVMQCLGIEGWSSLSATVWFEQFDKVATTCPAPAGAAATDLDGRRATARDAASRQQRAVWFDRDNFEDCWGIRWRLGEGGRYVEWRSGPLEDAGSVRDIEAYAFPTADHVRGPADYAAEVARLKNQDRYVTAAIDNPFKRYWHLRGYENALMDYLGDPELLEAGYDRLFALVTVQALCAARAGVDMIKCVGDVAMQDRIIMGRDLWQRYDKPRWARFIDDVRAIKSDMVFFFHSDGKLTDLVDDLIDVGFTVINPIQPECMEPVEIKRRYGDRITLHGGISLQRTLPFGSVDDGRREVERLIRDCGRDGGLVAMPSNVIQPDTPLENVIACFHAARDLRLTA